MRQGEGEAGSLLSRALTQGWIPGPQDHDLSRRQPLNGLSHPGATKNKILKKKNPQQLPLVYISMRFEFLSMSVYFAP